MKSEEEIRRLKRNLELTISNEIKTKEEKDEAVFTLGKILLLQWVLSD